MIDPPSLTIAILAAGCALLLIVQLAAVRPRLNRRSDQVLAGHGDSEAPRSRAHHAYIGLETLKIAALAALGSYLLAA